MLRQTLTALVVLTTLISPSLFAADDLLIADFESATYGQWQVEGEAFGPGPAEGTLPGQMHVSGYRGKRLVNSFFRGDATTGSLTSASFTIERKYIAFLIGGGRNPEQLALQLIIDGKVVHSSSGPNDRAGGSEELLPEAWDVTQFAGQQAKLKIIDNATGGWGHINVDHIVQSDKKPSGLLSDITRQFLVTGRFLQLPIKNGAPLRKVTLLVGDKSIVTNDIALTDEQPDWWAPLDVSKFQGQSVVLKVDRVPESFQALQRVEVSSEIRGEMPMYTEPLRGQFHFSPRRGWNNDPNGLVYFKGEYHMFFQHNPYGWGWGNMHWGHAVSTDLVHWKELGDVLSPDQFGPMFSGSAVVDWKNTSGFGSASEPPLVLIYTAAGSPTVQCIAYSTDGRNFTKYDGNPVVQQFTPGNRDPKVFWHDPTKRWVMVLYVEKDKVHTTHILTSTNLREWTVASVAAGDPDGKRYLFECPDMFPLAVDNDKANTQWVLQAADSQYAIGQFDGLMFTPEHERLMGHQGRGFYAAQSFSDLPDARRIQVGWFQTETQGMPFNQSMTIPLELGLHRTKDGPRLTYAPVKELDSLRSAAKVVQQVTVQAGSESNILKDQKAELSELRVDMEASGNAAISIDVRGIAVEYDFGEQVLVVNGHRVKSPTVDGRQNLIIYCDRTGLEVFASRGLTYIPMPVNLASENRMYAATASRGEVKLNKLEFYELKSAWEK